MNNNIIGLTFDIGEEYADYLVDRNIRADYSMNSIAVNPI